MEYSGKAFHSSKNAEKKRSEGLRRDLFVLTYHFLIEEGLIEAAEVMRDQLEPLMTQFSMADNVDLPLILMDYMAYYRLRFNKEPLLCRKKTDQEAASVSKQRSSRRPLNGPGKLARKYDENRLKEIKIDDAAEDTNYSDLGGHLRIPRSLAASEEDRELVALIAKDVTQRGNSYIKMKDVVGLVRNFLSEL